MSKKHITRAAVSAKAPFPEDRHVLTPPQREIPNLAAAMAAMAEIAQPQPSERARLCAATVSQEQREIRARHEALAILERESADRDALAFAEVPAPTVHEDLQAVRRRPLDAPMATWTTWRTPALQGLPDPLAQSLWDAISLSLVAPALSLWQRVKLPAAFGLWSVSCFLLGRLV